MATPIKAAVRRVDLERFKLDGGALVVYPPAKRGHEITAGMVAIEIVDADAAKAERFEKRRRKVTGAN